MAEPTLLSADAIKTEKKAKLQLRIDYDLHVLLIMRQQSVPKSEALVIAYAEGRNGLGKRLD